jgi:hypothetical protein
MEEIIKKKCSKCGEDKPATTEYFSKHKRSKYGLRNECKECDKIYKKQYKENNLAKYKELKKQCAYRYYNKNKTLILEKTKAYAKVNAEKIKKYKAKYCIENKDILSQKRKEYYNKNKEKMNLQSKMYYRENIDKMKIMHKNWKLKNKNILKQKRIENKEIIKNQSKLWREKNKENIKRYSKMYKEKNKEAFKEYRRLNKTRINNHTQKRKAKKRQLPNSLTVEQWQNIKIKFNNRCAYCGRELPLAQEHFVPLSEGGEYTINNIIPSCKHCNSSKNDRNFFEWYKNYEFYSKERENFILKYLGYKNKEKLQQLKII